MTRWDDPPPTGAQLWIYRHRRAVGGISALGLLAVAVLATVRLLEGDGAVAVIASLASAGGFVIMLISARVVEGQVERQGKADHG